MRWSGGRVASRTAAAMLLLAIVGCGDATALRHEPSDRRYLPGPIAEARTGLSLPVGKCLNYAGQFDLRADAPGIRPEVDSDFAEMRRAGFRTLRLPVNFDRFTGTAPPYRVDPALLARVGHVVRVASAAGLNVIVDSHYHDALMRDPAGGAARFAAMWEQIGRYLAPAPPTTWFELLNEPQPPMTADDLPTVLAPALAAVRRSNPRRPVIIGGERWSGVPSLRTLWLPDDPYVVPTIHYYEPMAFTHQGATWLHPVPPLGATWGSEADLAQLDRNVAAVRAYIDETGRVPFVGEMGAMPDMPLDQRVRWYETVSRAFAAIGVSSCALGYYNAWPIRNRAGWIAPLVDRLAAPR